MAVRVLLFQKSTVAWTFTYAKHSLPGLVWSPEHSLVRPLGPAASVAGTLLPHAIFIDLGNRTNVSKLFHLDKSNKQNSVHTTGVDRHRY